MRIVETKTTAAICRVCPERVGVKGSKGLCRKHYVNARNNPMLPAEPLLAEIDRLGIAGDRIPEAVSRGQEIGFINLYAVDAFVVDVLKTHPAMIYGPDFFDPEFSFRPDAVIENQRVRAAAA